MATSPFDDFIVDFPTLWVAIDWVERHCVIPDGFKKGTPYILSEWQSWYYANHYRVKPGAKLRPGEPGLGAPAFWNRRSQVIMPQKAGKGPLTASQCCLEAVGPAMFAGWAKGGETYDCRNFGCGCGWMYHYEPDEPMGRPWPTPLIQITAFSQEQADNVYSALRPMLTDGPLSDVVGNVNEDFIRLPGGGRIDAVTSSNQSRLGQRVTFVPQDEVGLWLPTNKMVKVASTQRRGASGMMGRVVETSNGWDPAEDSVAQRTYNASLVRHDIFRLHPQAPNSLSFTNKAERRRILRYVYAGCPWVDIESINSEAEELITVDPAEAERFYGNRIVAGLGSWLRDEMIDAHIREDILVPEGSAIAIGFDGSDTDDWTALRCETQDGHRFTPTYGPNRRPAYWNPAEWGGTVPRGEVRACVDELNRRYRIRRMFCDPRDWRTEIGEWALLIGEDVVLEWSTYRIDAMFLSLQRARNDLKAGRTTLDGDKVAREHLLNARMVAKPGDKYILGKPDRHRKIDIAIADTLAHEAAGDLHALGPDAWRPRSNNLTRAVGRGRSY